ncbi:MAG: hypothetical protein ACRD12_02525 [Acidimicrobiales bacterium]
MRQIRRPRVWPPTIAHPGGRGYEHARQQRRESALRQLFPKSWRANDVRGVLRATCGHSCAYCLDLIGRTGEDVEHYRPKDKYWWLAYSLDNYLSSCRRCNSSRKIDAFPLRDESMRARDPRASLASEERLLLDPVADDVEAILLIDVLGAERVAYRYAVARTADGGLAEQGQATIGLFHLNDDVELAKARKNAVAEAVRGLASDDAEARGHARRRMSRFEPFGGAVRSVVAQLNPTLLPQPEEELHWFVGDLLDLLDLVDVTERPDRKIIDVTRFALAALWRDPPAASASDIERRLELAGRQSEIRPYYELLAKPGPVGQAGTIGRARRPGKPKRGGDEASAGPGRKS